MCGICGFARSDGTRPESALLRLMADQMAHRGPDDAGVEVSETVGFGFRRLAILDLSPAGHQPMWDANGEVMVVFNGEIYNFVELRQELQSQGAVFRSSSDTEVLLQLYLRHGVDALQKLDGMFAFAVYDRRTATVLLARDRLGVKPLFYWSGPNGLAFASELSALRQIPGFPGEIDPLALSCYLRLGIIPEWTCIHPDVRKLPPGAWLRFFVNEGRIEGPTSYWNLPVVGEGEGGSEKHWLDEIEALLKDATRIRLRSDVPLGLFLSGGIDSGLVAAMAISQERSLSSLTIGFEEEGSDETPLALATARHLTLRPFTRQLRLAEAQTLMSSVMGHFDEPFADSSALPTSLVCAEARKQFTVVLSGDAGDEVFGGYPNHVRAWRWRHVDRIPLALRRLGSRSLAAFCPPDSRLRRFARRLGEPVGCFGLGGKLFAFQDWQDTCLKPEFNLEGNKLVDLYSRYLSAWPGASSVDLAQRTDLRQYLLEDILVKVDRMSMRHSLEVRSPFLDYRMIELGLRIPSKLRVQNGINKYLLRRLAERHLPREVCDAPKRGFAIPLSEWLFHSRASEDFRQTLLESHSGFPDPLVPGAGERLWNSAKRTPELCSAVFVLLAYRWWCAQRRHSGP